MTDSFNLAELQNPSLDFERQRFLQKWLIQSRPHMGTSCQTTTEDQTTTNRSQADSNILSTPTATGTAIVTATVTAPIAIASASSAAVQPNSNNAKHLRKNINCNNHSNNLYNPNPVFFLRSSNGHTNTAAVAGSGARNKSNGTTSNINCGMPSSHFGVAPHHLQLTLNIEGRKPKLRRFNSHDTSSNMFSVADFENARLARRNEIEMKQRLQKRVRPSCSGIPNVPNCGVSGNKSGGLKNGAYFSSWGNIASVGGDCSTGDSKTSKHSNDSLCDPLSSDVFFERHTMPTVVHISYRKNIHDETLQSSSSNGSSTVTSNSSTSAASNDNPNRACASPCDGSTALNIGTGTSSSTASSSGNNVNAKSDRKSKSNTSEEFDIIKNATSNNVAQKQGQLFLLYKFIQQRCIYYGHNTKLALTSRKKSILIPQEFSGYFSLVNEKGLPTATQYNSVMQLVRERVFKFVSVENIPAFAESQPNQTHSPSEGCFPIYSTSAQTRPQYIRTTARAGEVYRLIAVFEDGKQDHNAINGGINSNVATQSGSSNYSKSSGYGREKEKGRYAQLMSDGRQVYYVPLSTKGKFYEVEPGIPVILQRVGINDSNKKIKPDCVYRITELVTPQRELPLSLRYISGPNSGAHGIPENLSINKVIKENIVIVCPIEDIEIQRPLHLQKLYLTKEMYFLKSFLGFDNDKSMWSDPNVQNLLKFCQFNCDQFLQSVEIENVQRSERSGSKQRGDGLKLLKPLQLPKLLRREKTAISAHEREDSIIFLTKTDLANLEAKESATTSSATGRSESSMTSNRISEKMKVFQSTKKKWFRKQDKHSVNSLTCLDFDAQVKRMSMERYTDMSRLLQERFGEKSNDHPDEVNECKDSISEPSCSDTDTTALTIITLKQKNFQQSKSNDNSLKQSNEPSYSYTLQKSMSLQDIAIQKNKSNNSPFTDNISETGTDLTESECFEPFSQITSFITEKLYNEFHVKTRQHSKSSSSLNQLINFSLPQKLNVYDHKRTLAQLRQNFTKTSDKPLEFDIGAPVTGRLSVGGMSQLNGIPNNSQITSLKLGPKASSLIEDELPYSSVRDSLVLSNDIEDVIELSPAEINPSKISGIDYTKENIYAEICHEASAMGGVPNSFTQNTIANEKQSTQIPTSDDFGDYASLTYDIRNQIPQQKLTQGNAISRVQINCTSSPIGNHTIYLGNELITDKYREKQQQSVGHDPRSSCSSNSSHQPSDRSHITTVELEGNSRVNNIHVENNSKNEDSIYSTLK